MRTKISAKKNNSQAGMAKSVVPEKNTVKLRNRIYVEIPDQERKLLAAFYSMKGMRPAFFAEYPANKRDDVDNGLGLIEGRKIHKIRVSLLDDLRSFYNDHKDEVKDLIS